MASPAARAFVCGHPIAHSRSPLIHGYWLKHYGIAGCYKAVEVTPAAFPAFLQNLRGEGFAGGNVTIPHKEAAFQQVQKRDRDAEEIGAVNTVWFAEGLLCGTNTDAYGFAANLDERAPGWDRIGAAVVLGAGGAARAIVHALVSRGIGDVRILNRTLARAQQLADLFGANVTAHELDGTKEILQGAKLVVNTTALGMDGEGSLPADPELMDHDALVTDIVYVPLETPFLAAARRRGLRAVDGLGMLLHQAVPGFELWFGKRPEVTPELRELIVASLGRHA